jgi:hypothetical protein
MVDWIFLIDAAAGLAASGAGRTMSFIREHVSSILLRSLGQRERGLAKHVAPSDGSADIGVAEPEGLVGGLSGLCGVDWHSEVGR